MSMDRPLSGRTTATLNLTGVRAGYGDTVVIEDIGFNLPERGSLAVLGRNGVGKTTLLATIMGHTTFHAGSIEYRGVSVAKLPAYERSRLGIGYVPQAREIFPLPLMQENTQLFPAHCRAASSHWHQDFRRRTTDARHRARSHGNPIARADGRAARGARPYHRRASVESISGPDPGSNTPSWRSR